jgi:hypothetical protein
LGYRQILPPFIPRPLEEKREIPDHARRRPLLVSALAGLKDMPASVTVQTDRVAGNRVARRGVSTSMRAIAMKMITTAPASDPRLDASAAAKARKAVKTALDTEAADAVLHSKEAMTFPWGTPADGPLRKAMVPHSPFNF